MNYVILDYYRGIDRRDYCGNFLYSFKIIEREKRL